MYFSIKETFGQQHIKKGYETVNESIYISIHVYHIYQSTALHINGSAFIRCAKEEEKKASLM